MLGGLEGPWSVPDEGSSVATTTTTAAEDGGGPEQRAAKVLRYKEKRQSRLFSKRIRYEVRKLNAEKRPRIKVLRLIHGIVISIANPFD